MKKNSKAHFLALMSEIWDEYKLEFSAESLYDLIWKLLENRPDIILERFNNSHLGNVKSILADSSKIKIVSTIDTGMVRNYDGSGCSHKTNDIECEQTLIITKHKKTYSNRY